jgi:tetratricopeptide (TPR) repeat protein
VPAARFERLAWAAAAALLTAATFVPSLRGAFLNFDDDVNFLTNPRYRGLAPENLRWMFTDHFGHYMPLTWLTLGLDYVLWGMNPFGYHLSSVLLHSINAALCFALMGRLLDRALPEHPPRARHAMALAGALFFSLHPLRVESVAWITERRDVLSGLFFLLSLLAYLKSTDGPSRRLWIGASLAAFAASLLCKAMGMTLPFVLLILDAWPLRRFERERPRTVLIEKAPFFALLLAGAALSAWAQTSAQAVYSYREYPLAQIAGQPGFRVSFYVLKTLLPIGLSPLYFYRPVMGAGQVVGWAAVLGLSVLLWRRRRDAPAAAAAWAAYLVLIGPVSGFAQAGPHAVADRYSYLACLPFAGLFAAAPAFPSSPAARRAAGALAAVALALLAGLTVRQCGYWHDSVALWDRAISIEPDVYFSLHNRGTARLAIQDSTGALADFDRAITLNPRYPNPWYNRGTLRAALGDQTGAVEDYTASLQLDPNQANVLSARGLARTKLGDRAGSFADVDAAVRQRPDLFQPRLHRGLVRLTWGDPAAALEDFTRAVALEPLSSVARFQRGRALFQLGRRPEALADFNRALELRPDDADALAQRGLTRALLHDPSGALSDLTESLRLRPDPAAYLLRAKVRGMQSDLRGAVEDCDRAIGLKPGFAEAHAHRGNALLELGERAEAARALQRALDLAPPDWPQRRATEALLFKALPH